MKKNTKKLLIYIYFILLCCVFFCTALSRNMTKVNGSGKMELAGIKLNIITQTNSITDISSTEQSISFVVNNYDGTKENPIYNDTQYEYQISITTQKDIPLEYKLYKVENGQETEIPLTSGTSGRFTMPHSEIQEDNFILRVKLDDKNYQNMQDVMDINVYAVQS